MSEDRLIAAVLQTHTQTLTNGFLFPFQDTPLPFFPFLGACIGTASPLSFSGRGIL